ncbi:unnamed protein product [Heligmosomoides polygyrus]|uniref:Uncharacterized protein n=1 Tax=Heligmosomoides polygyrus TaxID=6339 RepID=A0A183GF93_HELPZ|nr:unnamed protein product [Heligmosomoides polygyrus]
MDPPRSRDTKSVIWSFRTFTKKSDQRVGGRPDIPRRLVGDGSRPACACEVHYVAGLPNFRRLRPCNSGSDLRTSARLGTPEAFSYLRESCHSEHRPLDSTLRDTDRVFIQLSYSGGVE